MNILRRLNFFHSYDQERNKILKILILTFLITFVYELLKPIKTALIVTAEGSHAGIIHYLRMWVVFPSSFIMMGILSKLSNRFKREQIFYLMLSSFLIFFLIFTLLLYPYRNIFELQKVADFLYSKSWLKNKELLLIIRYWHLSFFFALSELWVTVILSILFWGYVNEVTSMDNAKKFYGVLLLVGNSSVVFSGLLGHLFVSPALHTFMPFGANAWDKTIYSTLTFILAVGVAIILIFVRLDHINIQKKQLHEAKTKISIMEIFKSSHLVYLSLIVVAYNISYNLIEVLWTNKLHQSCPDPAQFSLYISRVVSVTGALSILLALFVCRQAIEKLGWTITALITPLICLLTGLSFLLCIFLEENFLYQMIASFLGLTPVVFTVLVGAIQISLGKASKYTLFDQTKEISFIPLAFAEQRAGKVWIEGIVTWVGKLGAALIYQLLSLLCADNYLTSCMLCTFVGLLLVWIVSVGQLGKSIRIYNSRAHVTEKNPDPSELTQKEILENRTFAVWQN